MNKRFASLAVSALLLVSLLSVPALAEGTEAAADTAGDDHVIVTLNPETALQPETPAEAAASATETAQADPVPSAYDAASAATAAKAEVKADDTKDQQLTYVALGDSIVSGVGLADVQYSARSGYSVDMAPNFHGYSPDCYVGKVAAALGLDRDHAINLGLPALTAPDLADMIRYGKMPQMNMASGCEYNYPEFQDYIRKADVVSVQIGSNDAFVPCIVALGNATNWKSEKLAATILAGDLRNEGSGSTMSAIYRSIKAMDLTKAERDATWNLLFSGMSKICDETYPKTTAALISIVQEIRNLNPDAQIILVGYTNPVPLIPCWRSYFNKLNKFEKQIAKTYNLTYVAIPNTETTLDVHPTIKGSPVHRQQARERHRESVITNTAKPPVSAGSGGFFPAIRYAARAFFDVFKDGVAVLTADHDHLAGGDSRHAGGRSDLVLVFEVMLHGLLLALDIGIHRIHHVLRLALGGLDDGHAVDADHHAGH